MYPYLTIFNKEVPTYAVLAIIGILLMGYYVIKNAEKKGYSEVESIKCLLSAGLGGVLGAHFVYFITNFHNFISLLKNITVLNSIKKVFYAIGILFGGWVFYGGLIGGILGIIIYCKLHKIKPLDYLNIGAPGIALFHFLGRIGCFLAGCCYGVESHVGFTFHHSDMPGANGVSRFPIQLVESLYCLILFILLDYLLRKTKYRDKTAYLYLILYPIGRFIFEFFRGDAYRGFLWIFSTSQWISIILFIIGIFGIIKSRKRA